MKRSDCIGFSLICAAAAMACLGAAPSQAQAPAPKGTVNVVPDPGDLSGVWVSARFNADRDAERGRPTSPTNQQQNQNEYKQPPLLPWATQLMQQRAADAKVGHPYAFSKSRCLPAGTPGSMFPPAALPIQILETPGQITILFEEFNQFRIIHMNAKHQADPDPGYFGDSVGHWEGDTLVVDTIGLNDKTSIGNGGIPHTENLHVVERIRRNGKDTIEDQIVMDDPKTFTGVWKMQNILKRVPGMRLAEYFCDNDRNTPDATGRTGVALPSASR